MDRVVTATDTDYPFRPILTISDDDAAAVRSALGSHLGCSRGQVKEKAP
jgi:hypothetical protein